MDIDYVFGGLTFYVTAIVSVIAVMFMLRIFYLRRQHVAMSIVTNTAGIVNLAMYVITGLIAISYSRYRFDNFKSWDEQTIFALTYAAYFLLWIMANSYFLNQIARIPQDRRTQFEIVKWILRLEVVALILLAASTAGFTPLFELGLLGLERGDLVELVFVLLAVAALFTFIYFYRALGRERDNNASKLIKARIQLMQYAIIAQIFMSLAIMIGAAILFTNTVPSLIIEFSIFASVSLVSLVTNIIMVSSINIPNSVRVRFNIAPKRFKFVVQSHT